MNKKLITFFAFSALLTLPFVALAADPGTWINGIATRFLNIVLWPIFAAVIVIMFIFAGFLFVTANGDPTKIATAKKAVIWAIVGIVVAIAAFSIYGIIVRIIGNGGGGGGGVIPTGTGGNSCPGPNGTQVPC